MSDNVLVTSMTVASELSISVIITFTDLTSNKNDITIDNNDITIDNNDIAIDNNDITIDNK